MPIFHPECPRIPPELYSEQQVLAALRTLPPEAHVFVRLGLVDPENRQERELDFLVIHPRLGLVILEVKGRGVEPRGDHWIRKDRAGREQRLVESPGDQIKEQQYALLRFLQKAGLKFVPQITRTLALPALPLKAGQSLGPDLPACLLLTREKLQNPFRALQDAVSGGTDWDRWRERPEARHHEVRPECMKDLLEALLPSVLPPPSLAEILGAEGRFQDATARPILDHLALNFAQGRYHISGAPGSGKSLLARQVARLWASEGRRILVVAFNRALVYATQCALEDLILEDRALVSTYHDLAVNLLQPSGRLPECEDPARFFGTQIPEALAAWIAEGGTPEGGRWEGLVVDEAQDLDPAWVHGLLGLLRCPERDPVLVLEDPAQNLYREARHDLGHPWRLDLNLRQHAAIRREACLAYPACGWPLPEETPDEGAVRRLPSSPATWKRDLATLLHQLSEEGLHPRQVLVISPHRADHIGVKDRQLLGPWHLNTIPDWWEDEKAEHLRLGTVHGFKGLEADVVIYLAPAYRHRDAPRLAYTAYSRARHRLFILEKAIPEPSRPPAEAPKAPAPQVPPGLHQPKVRSLSPGQQQGLLEALGAARDWKPERR